MPLRETARDAVLEQTAEYAARGHQAHWHRLYVWRNGAISWRTESNRDDQLTDDSDTAKGESDSIQSIRNIGPIGCGDIPCTCDWCSDEGYDPSEDDAIGYVQDALAANFDETLPAGYFDDELRTGA